MATYYPGYAVAGWLGLSAPAGTPAPIVQKMNQYMRDALADAATAGKFRDLGLQPESMDVAAFDAFVKAAPQRWQDWVDTAGINTRFAAIAPRHYSREAPRWLALAGCLAV